MRNNVGFRNSNAYLTLLYTTFPRNQLLLIKAVCAKETFEKLNNLLWNMLWTWCKRRHPNKGKHWIVKKFWKTVQSRQWVFMHEQTRLIDAGDIPIMRHVALKLDKNPFLDRAYFEARKASQRRKNATTYWRTTAAHLFDG